MKLNLRFLLTTFIVVLIISISSTYIFYSLTSKLLIDQQSKTVLNAATNFAFSFQSELQKTDEEFRKIIQSISKRNTINIDSLNIDFVFTLVNDSLINSKEFKVKSNSYLNIRTSSFKKFLTDNPGTILRYTQLKDGRTFYYGRLISTSLLNSLREKINAEIALVVNDSPIEISFPEENQTKLQSILNSARYLKLKNSYDLYTEVLSEYDFVSTLYSPRLVSIPQVKVNFIVFQSFKEGNEFRGFLQVVMLLIILAGTALTFIIVLVSTTRVRKQISALSKAADETSSGNLEHRVKIISNDEIGNFGATFNKMLDELARNKKAEKDYSEFITLINQNPSLKEIGDAALSKIIKTTNLTFGALYLTEYKNIRLISSYGLGKQPSHIAETDLFNDAIEKKETIELYFQDNYPEIKAGITSVKLKYLIIYPVIFNKGVIAILELASESIPKQSIQQYINTINEQLAVGLVNAKSFEQLENLVSELQNLNNDYHKQNIQISEQNDELKKLHKQLQEKAEEFEKQRAKALELTKVKSEFLASMSHELRTPLISILGLTELMLKDSGIVVKVKERLGIVNRNGNKLLGLINNILEFSKFDSGKIDLKIKTFILSDLLEEIKQNVYQLALEKNLKLVFSYPENKTILLNTDKDKLEQVLLNLIVNAIKFTESGYIEVKAEIIKYSDITFEIIDTGIGISDEDQKVIFNEFEQADKSTSRKYNGAGLGLAISKKYIELLGSSITLKSEYGKGSKFSFILYDSVLDSFEKAEHKFLTIDQDETSAEPLYESKKQVLIVRDFYTQNDIISDYLKSYSIKCVHLITVEDAVKALSKEKYLAVIINFSLDTFNLISAVKSSGINCFTPIIIHKIYEDRKYGWTPDVYDFIINNNTEINLEEVISRLEKEKQINIKEIMVVSDSKKRKDSTNIVYAFGREKCNIKKTASTDLLRKQNHDKTELIIIEVGTVQKNIFEICHLVKSSKVYKNSFVLFILPRLSEIDAEKNMISEFDEIAKKVKMHPLDILKIIRDKLELIDVPEISNTILLDNVRKENVLRKSKSTKTKKTILIVDDDNDALFTVGEYVKELGYDTIFAHNGMECLLMLNHVLPDLILLDIMMPQMDGFETIKRIRDEASFSKMPVIALTAYAMLDNQNVIEKNGFNDLVTKPINFQLLSSKISKYLK